MRDSNDVIVIDRLDGLREAQLLALFQSAWWTTKRTPAAVKQMLNGSDAVVGLVDPATDRLVGFARAISDRVFLAVVLDVIVDPDYRGTGLGRRLMDGLLQRPELTGVDSVELVCQPELADFYRRWGFTDAVGRSLLMRRTDNALLTGAPESSS
jgi:GNAT superfamily N-acetyltransferase